STLDPDALTSTCWPKRDEHCLVGFLAVTINPGIHKGLEQNFKGTLIGLCPRFFELPDLKEVIRKFDRKDTTLVVTAALTIVHEMQHVFMTTGKGRLCVDHKYDAEECKKLDEKKKITNAQNMALFALDVTAHPERGCLSPKEGCCWC
ncbi:hypothetical protein BGZ61DRAFT_345481, partial [Ilyonectria robusta]|uniref:uncharacterized protein n=1 Tax=Ilyonectria robusta TaxID=1079257 RepID=UPI001E8D1C79